MPAHAELLRLEAEGEGDKLRQVEDGEVEVAVDDLGRLRLLPAAVTITIARSYESGRRPSALVCRDY